MSTWILEVKKDLNCKLVKTKRCLPCLSMPLFMCVPFIRVRACIGAFTLLYFTIFYCIRFMDFYIL